MNFHHMIQFKITGYFYNNQYDSIISLNIKYMRHTSDN